MPASRGHHYKASKQDASKLWCPWKKLLFHPTLLLFSCNGLTTLKLYLTQCLKVYPKNTSFWKSINVCFEMTHGKYKLLKQRTEITKNKMRLFWGSFQTVWIAFQDPLGFYSTFFIWAVTWKVPLLLLQLHQLEPFHLLMFLATVSLHSSSFSSSHKGTFCIRF